MSGQFHVVETDERQLLGDVTALYVSSHGIEFGIMNDFAYQKATIYGWYDRESPGDGKHKLAMALDSRERSVPVVAGHVVGVQGIGCCSRDAFRRKVAFVKGLVVAWMK